MAKHQKALERLCATPTPADIKWTELVAALEHLGYEQFNHPGSRRKFIHKGKKAVISCHQPHPSPDVDRGCVRDVVEHLRNYGFI